MGTAIGDGQDGVNMSRIWRRSANMAPLWAQHVARRPQARANVGPTCSKTSRWSPMCPIWSPMAPTCTQHLRTSSGAETSSKTGLPVTPKSQGQDEISVYRGGVWPPPQILTTRSQIDLRSAGRQRLDVLDDFLLVLAEAEEETRLRPWRSWHHCISPEIVANIITSMNIYIYHIYIYEYIYTYTNKIQQ